MSISTFRPELHCGGFRERRKQEISSTSSTKEAVIAAVDAAWRELRGALSSLRSKDMEVPGVCGEWSVKDVVGHVTTWDAELVEAIITRSGLPRGNVDAFNEAAARQKAGLPAREVMAQMEEMHRMLRDELAALPSSSFEPGEGMRRIIDEASVMHYEEHTAQILTWLRKRRRPSPARG